MARSNNQRRRDAKRKGTSFTPAWTKSATRRSARRVKATSAAGKSQGPRKLAYGKVQDRSGRIKQRKFRSKSTGAKKSVQF